MSGLLRVTLRYDANEAEILDCVPIRGVAPVQTLALGHVGDGAWIEVLDRRGQGVFAQVLADPHVGRESSTTNGALARDGITSGARMAMLDLPWPGAGASLRVHVSPPLRDAQSIAPPKTQVTTLALNPVATSLALDAAPPPPMLVYATPGANNPKALTLAIFAEGFRLGEMPAFRQAATAFVERLSVTSPFDRLMPALRLIHFETVSNCSGINGSSAGDTCFKGRFQTGALSRIILIEELIATRLLSQLVPRSAVALVIANTLAYGGSGGAAPVFSCEPRQSPEIALHELGHTLFGLADEYSAAGQSSSPNPIEANVCGSARRADLKWADLIRPETPLPTPLGNSAANAPVGAYEGAKY